MRLSMLAVSTSILAGCIGPAAPDASTFAREVENRVAGPMQSCIAANSSDSLRVLDRQTLAYGFGSTIFVNRLSAPCPGLSASNTIVVLASTGAQYCRGDQVRGVEAGATIPGPACTLESWVPYRRP